MAYHELGKYKWEELGYKYELENIKSPTQEKIEEIKKVLELS